MGIFVWDNRGHNGEESLIDLAFLNVPCTLYQWYKMELRQKRIFNVTSLNKISNPLGLGNCSFPLITVCEKGQI